MPLGGSSNYGSGEAGAAVGHLGSDLIWSDLDFEDDRVGG